MDAIIYKDTIYGGGGAMRGNYFDPIIYSTEERVVGVWVDNKPLYQKTIVFGSITNRSSISIGVENVEHISLVPDGSWVNDGERPLPCVIGSDASNNIGGYFTIGTSDTSFEVRMGNGSASDSRNGVITVQYTKTTDVAGSGAYNTLGVPNVHYTTDEQVIGTWLDGKPLYQKTYSINETIYNQDKSIDVSSLNIDKYVSGEGTFIRNVNWASPVIYIDTPFNLYESSSNHSYLRYGITNKTMDYGVFLGNNETATDITFTIKYTKTTD